MAGRETCATLGSIGETTHRPPPLPARSAPGGRAVAARPLGAAERGVGAGEPRRNALLRAQLGDTRGQRDGDPRGLGAAGNHRTQRLGNVPGLGEPGERQQHHELLAAVAEQPVVAAQAARAERRQAAQHAVPGQVPVAVVDGLEVVDVEHHEGHGGALAAGEGVCRAQAVTQRPPVAGAGERVVRGGPLQGSALLLEPPKRQGQEQVEQCEAGGGRGRRRGCAEQRGGQQAADSGDQGRGEQIGQDADWHQPESGQQRERRRPEQQRGRSGGQRPWGRQPSQPVTEAPGRAAGERAGQTAGSPVPGIIDVACHGLPPGIHA